MSGYVIWIKYDIFAIFYFSRIFNFFVFLNFFVFHFPISSTFSHLLDFFIKIVPFRCYGINSLQLTDGREWVLLFPTTARGSGDDFRRRDNFVGRTRPAPRGRGTKRGVRLSFVARLRRTGGTLVSMDSQLWNQPAGIRFALTRTISRHASQPLGQRGKGENRKRKGNCGIRRLS